MQSENDMQMNNSPQYIFQKTFSATCPIWCCNKQFINNSSENIIKLYYDHYRQIHKQLSFEQNEYFKNYKFKEKNFALYSIQCPYSQFCPELRSNNHYKLKEFYTTHVLNHTEKYAPISIQEIIFAVPFLQE